MTAHLSTRPVAIVTGAFRGIGLACATGLATSGFNILPLDLDTPANRELVLKITAHLSNFGADNLPYFGDVGNLLLHSAILQAALDRWGRIDCLVNNAGVSVQHRGDLLDVQPDSFDNCIRVNTRAVFFFSQAIARHMVSVSGPTTNHRSIINVTSSNAKAVSIARGEYCVSKAASTMTTRLFAVRLAPAGIGVYEVRPGIIDTVMTRPAKDHYDKVIAEHQVPAERWGTSADVASTVVAMAEGRLPYTVGQAVTVDGGFILPRF